MIAWAEPTYESLAAPALSLLERALAGAPDNPVALAKLGNVHIDRYDFAKAAEAFRKVLDI
ncbi:MAG TPA: tetratricopeptide repeat protein, partial [Rhizomicrobium sp.]